MGFKTQDGRAQTGLEYIILIGGVVILSAASYFLMKGFLISSGGSTHETMGRATDASRQDLLNLGLQPVSLSRSQWYSVGSSLKTSFFLRNTGTDDLGTEVRLKKTSFSGNGVNTDEFEIGFLSIGEGDYGVLDDSASNATDFVFETPVIPAAGELEVVLSYNNSSPYTPVTSFEYIIEESDIVLVDGSVESEEKTDFAPPVLGEVVVDTPSAGVGETISFRVPVNETSGVSEASFSVSVDHTGGTFSTSVFDADGLYSVVTGLPGGSLVLMGYYSDGNLFFEFVAPDPGAYWFSFLVFDEWANNGSGEVVLNVSESGTQGGGAPAPPVLSSLSVSPTEPGAGDSITFSVTATDSDGVAWCGLSVYNGGTQIDNQSMSKNGDVYSHVEASGFSAEEYTAEVNCSDTMGNVSSVSETFTVSSVSPSGWTMFHFDPANTGAPDYGSEVEITGAGWPQYINYGGHSSPAVADLDGIPGNGLEIVVGSGDANVYAFHANANPVSGWPQSTSDPIESSPILVDIDVDGDLEVLVGTGSLPMCELWAWHHDGTVVSGWPQSTGSYVLSSPAAADLDGNISNGLEIVVGSGDSKVWAWHANGSNVSGWPKTTGDLVGSSPSIVDMDLDGELEVVVVSLDYNIYAWEADGSAVTGWPKIIEPYLYSSPAVADLDNNPSNGLEVVIGSSDGKVHAWHADGTVVSGWPKDLGDYYLFSSAAVADLDNNPSNGLEVVIGSDDNNVYAWHADGSTVSGWPKTTGDDVLSSPAVADLDANPSNGLEVVVGSDDHNLYAWHADGSTVSGWPVDTFSNIWSSPALVDIDGVPGNGLEVVGTDTNGDVFVFHSDASLFEGGGDGGEIM